MKNILILFSLLFIYTSCIKEDEPITYYHFIRLKNVSNKVFKIVIEDTETNHKYLDRELQPNESTDYYQHYLSSDTFLGFAPFGDRIYLRFIDNNKGYICGDYPDNSGFCFTSKNSPIRNPNESDFILDKKENNNTKYYTYEITQQDYENAHVLP